MDFKNYSDNLNNLRNILKKIPSILSQKIIYLLILKNNEGLDTFNKLGKIKIENIIFCSWIPS